MKVVIAALNSKYPHLSLAPWYLKAACADGPDDIEILELTINQTVEEITREIYAQSPEVLAFSCYIFNITLVEGILRDLKKILPKTIVVLGGPEVSFDARQTLERNTAADYIVVGEGEAAFPRLLDALRCGQGAETLDGVACRIPGGNECGSRGRIRCNPPAPPTERLDDLPSPFTQQMLDAAKGKILYYESSRGCPFHCSYCLSSTSGGVRFFGMDRVRDDLERIVASGVTQVKFVDRTFNCNPRRAKEIVRLAMDLAQKYGRPEKINFHFEAAADLFDDELTALLAGAPSGLFQLEIGLQSFNAKTLEACSRQTNLEKCCANITKLLAAGNMHIHLDLIAGLPYEDFTSFALSFDRAYALAPHCIQLGFLKLLKGSAMRGQADARGVLYRSLPPYEVLSTPELSFDDLLRLKDTEFAVDRLYNSGHFIASLRFLTQKSRSPFWLLFDFAQHVKARDGFEKSLSLRALYDHFYEFAAGRLNEKDFGIFNELIKYDYFLSDNSCNPPDSIRRIQSPQIKAIYSSMKKTSGRVHYEAFAFNPLQYLQNGAFSNRTVLCFDYTAKHRVTGLYSAS